jgi:hypothetical protein
MRSRACAQALIRKLPVAQHQCRRPINGHSTFLAVERAGIQSICVACAVVASATNLESYLLRLNALEEAQGHLKTSAHG